MDILLLRHGIAEEPRPDLDDGDRALTDDGLKRLRRASLAWQKLLEPPAVIFVSPLRRARETAAVFAEALRGSGELRVDKALVPGAHPRAMIELLEAENLQGTKGVAAVGHEPHLGYLLAGLLTGDLHLPIPLKKGMLVGLATASSTSLVAELRFALTQKAAAELGRAD